MYSVNIEVYMDKARKVEIDKILMKTEEDIKNGNFKDMSWEEFLKRQHEREKIMERKSKNA